MKLLLCGDDTVGIGYRDLLTKFSNSAGKLLWLATLGALLLTSDGCNTSERLNRLEKQNQELQAEVRKERATSEYDLQVKCSRDAKLWFNENWQSDKGTRLLDYTNHYNKALNKCFILVEYHFVLGEKDPSWTNDLELYDVYENSKIGSMLENHTMSPTDSKPQIAINECIVSGTDCTTFQGFCDLSRPYMNN